MEALSMSNANSVAQQLQSSQSILGAHRILDIHDAVDLDDNSPGQKELLFISLVSQEQALYNPKHEYYRNTARKDAKWTEIGRNLGWAETQCKAKWKAMRDQYCRELKRSKLSPKTNVKWKYFKQLDFLRQFALSRNYRPRNINNINLKLTTENVEAEITHAPNMLISAISENHNNEVKRNACEEIKFAAIKMESGMIPVCDLALTASTTTNIKHEPASLISTLTTDQLNDVINQQQQQQRTHHHTDNWSYLAAATQTAAASNMNNSNTNLTSMQQQEEVQRQRQLQHHATPTTDAEFYNAVIECVNAATTGAHQSQLQPASNPDEEDDDPIHTFLNIESYFEKELISMIQQEDVLYNSLHPSYRNVKRKLEIWDDIAKKLKKSVKQCRLKWKALRDQYIREHKRLKNRENADSLPRWKHYDALGFLQAFIKQKSSDTSSFRNILQMPRADMEPEMEYSSPPHMEPNVVVSELEQPTDQQQEQGHSQLQLQLQPLPSLSGPHVQHQQQLQEALHQQQHQNHSTDALHLQSTHNDSLCGVGAGSSVDGYDEMDIDNFIIGDACRDTPHNIVTGHNNRIEQEEGDAVDVEVEAADDEQHKEDSECKSISQFDEFLQNSSDDSHEINVNAAQKDVKIFNLDSISGTQPCLQEQREIQSSNQMLGLGMGDVKSLNSSDSACDGNADESLQDNHASLFGNSGATETSSLLNSMEIDGIGFNVNTVAADTTATTPTHFVTTTTNKNNKSEDDEVGAFFKAIAMKIRNAEMPPIAFTELQIDILRVINGSLRKQ